MWEVKDDFYNTFVQLCWLIILILLLSSETKEK